TERTRPVAVWTLQSSSSSHAPGEVSRLTTVPFVVTNSDAGVCACSVPADVTSVIKTRNGSQARRLAWFIPNVFVTDQPLGTSAGMAGGSLADLVVSGRSAGAGRVGRTSSGAGDGHV